MSDKVKIVGIGDGGCSYILDIYEEFKPQYPLIMINTDESFIRRMPSYIPKVLIREGKEEEELTKVIEDTDRLYIIVALGGNTGAMLTPILLKLAKEKKIFTVCFTTIPFEFEGKIRRGKGLKTLTQIKDYSDLLINLDPSKHIKGKFLGEFFKEYSIKVFNIIELTEKNLKKYQNVNELKIFLLKNMETFELVNAPKELNWVKKLKDIQLSSQIRNIKKIFEECYDEKKIEKFILNSKISQGLRLSTMKLYFEIIPDTKKRKDFFYSIVQSEKDFKIRSTALIYLTKLDDSLVSRIIGEMLKDNSYKNKNYEIFGNFYPEELIRDIFEFLDNKPLK